MMKCIRLFLLATGVAGCASLSAAGSLPLVMLPATAKWVLQFDAQALRASAFGQELFTAWAESSLAAQINVFEATFAGDVQRDLVAITACGSGGEAQGGVVYLRGRWNLQKVAAGLAAHHPLTTASQGRHQILSWSEAKTSNREERQHVCLLSSNLVLLANRETALAEVLDTLDGKAPALVTVPAFKRMAALDTNAFLRVVAVDLKEILADNPQAAALLTAESLRLALQSEGDGALLNGVLKAPTPEAAQQLQMALVGIQAVAMFQGMKNPEVAKLAQSARSRVDGQEVSVVLTASVDTIKRLFLPPKHGAAN